MKPGKQFEALYHGTSKDLDTVLPPAQAKAGTPNSSYVSGNRRGTEHDPYTNASASGSEKHAWEFAGMTAQRAGGRAVVHIVEQPADAKPGLEPKEVLSISGFKVTGRQDIRPPEDVRKPNTFMGYHPNPRGRQGTLPIDWTPPGSQGSGYMSGYVARNGDQWNHPTERERLRPEKEAKALEAMQPKTPKPMKRIKGQMTLPGMGRLK